MTCTITESKSPETDPQFVKTIHEGKLELPPNRPAGQTVDITFSYDENQIMHASFKDRQSGKETSISLSLGTGKTAHDEIDKFLVD